MKNFFVKCMAVAVMLFLACGAQIQAQNLLKGLKEKAEKAVKQTVNGGNNGTSNKTNAASGVLNKATSAIPAGKGKTYYVSVSTGSARVNGACELYVEDYGLKGIGRRFDPETGLNLYDF